MELLYNGFSEKGLRRGVNQDVIGIFSDSQQGLFLVADGMGGHSEGERASRELKEACSAWWNGRCSETENQTFFQTVSELKDMLALTSRRIWEQTGRKEICGAAAVLLWICHQNYAVLWSGDSRCYMAERGLLGRKVRLLTTDDVWENQPDCIAGLPEETVRSHPNYGKLMRAVGVSENFICNVRTGNIRKNVLFALCSDGVYKYLPSGMLEQTLASSATGNELEKGIGKLREAVYRNQAPDNLSCVFVKAAHPSGRWL